MITKDILNASFKGVRFFVEKESLPKFGRNLTNHEYPNTSDQFVEDSGGFALNFELDCFVAGLDSKQKLNAVINACNEGGAGRLVMPYLGEYQVYAGECSVSIAPYIDSERIDFKLCFSQSRSEGGLAKDVDTSSIVKANGEAAREAALVSFSKKNGITKSDPLSKTIAQSDLIQSLRDVRKIINSVPNLARNNELLNSFGQVSKAVGDLISDSYALGQWLMGSKGIYTLLSTGVLGEGNFYLLSTILDLSNSFESKQTTAINLINFQANSFFDDPETFSGLSSDAYWVPDTKIRIFRNEQRKAFSEMHRQNLLIIAFELFGDAKFNDDLEAAAAKQKLELAYIDFIHNQSYSPQTLFNLESFESFDMLRLSSLNAAKNNQTVSFRVQKESYDSFCGSSMLNLAYLTQAEALKNESDLGRVYNAMRNANARRTYFVNGEFNVLRAS